MTSPRIEPGDVVTSVLATSLIFRRIATQLITADAAYDFDLALSPFTLWAYLCCGVRDLHITDFYRHGSISSIETDIHRLRTSISCSTPFGGHGLIAFGLRRGRYFLQPHVRVVRGRALEHVENNLPEDLQRLLDERIPPIRAA